MPCTLPPLQPGMSQWGTRAARGGVHPLATGRLWAASGAARASPPVRAHSVALPPRHPWPRVPWYWACVGQPGGGVGCHPLLGARFALAPRAVGLWGCCSGERSAVPAKPSQKKPAFSVAGPLAGLRRTLLSRKPVCGTSKIFLWSLLVPQVSHSCATLCGNLPRRDGQRPSECTQSEAAGTEQVFKALGRLGYLDQRRDPSQPRVHAATTAAPRKGRGVWLGWHGAPEGDW